MVMVIAQRVESLSYHLMHIDFFIQDLLRFHNYIVYETTLNCVPHQRGDILFLC